MVEGMLRNIQAGETFIVWDDDKPAATITINRWAKPELWTEQERAEPALYAH
jgi:TusA-related sulfurtransferase